VQELAETPAIRAIGLTKRFDSRIAFEALTFEVARGEVFGFLGPNGAGKTTTVRVLGTLLVPSDGTAEVAGVSLERGPELRSRISILPEHPGLYLRLSVKDNMEYFAGLHGIPRTERTRRIAVALEAVGLADRLEDLAGSLSKGLQQRAALARSLLNDPEVIFLDEPTQGLDASATKDVRELIDGFRAKGVTVFLTTHRLEEAERLCDRVAIINTTLRSIGRPADLRRKLFGSALEIRVDHPLTNPEAMFGAIPLVQGWQAVDGQYIVHVDDPRSAAPMVARAIVDSGAGLIHLAEVERTLEDVYLQLLRDKKAT
jgi:ABC-2 type transport system ATP-binding protein